MTPIRDPVPDETPSNTVAASRGAANTYRETAQPGDPQGSATLVIQTRQAQRLFRGRAKRHDRVRIISLQHFSELMRAIWVTASQDDPCADWYLVRVLEGIEQARLELSRLHQEIQERLQRVQGIEIQMAQFVAPVRVPLRFGTPYSYLGACLIADYDPWVCAILTAQHVGVLSRDTGETLRRRGARLIRRVFMIPLGWKPLTVIREDLQQNNLCARQARETMGELPNGIFAGTRRARIAPAIRKSSVVNDAVKKNTDIEGSYRDQTDGI